MKIWLSVATLLVGTASTAHASAILSFTQDGNNVVATGTGSLDLTGLTLQPGSFTSGTGVAPGYGLAIVGVRSPTGSSPINFYTGITGPGSFGSRQTTYASSGAGDTFGIYGPSHAIIVPLGYVSGALLAGSDTFSGATFQSLGLTLGSYVYKLPDDTFTVNIGPTAAAPEPESFALLGTGLLGLVGIVRRRL